MSTSHRQTDLPDAGGDVRVPEASVVIMGDVIAREDLTIERAIPPSGKVLSGGLHRNVMTA